MKAKTLFNLTREARGILPVSSAASFHTPRDHDRVDKVRPRRASGGVTQPGWPATRLFISSAARCGVHRAHAHTRCAGYMVCIGLGLCVCECFLAYLRRKRARGAVQSNSGPQPPWHGQGDPESEIHRRSLVI